ncbi:MAG: glycosyltransferase [Candidatus Marinimicrobia bacterium]|nr:glycosyltransferase [Candidatus Neomarinimicrobiota bacterium]
MLNNSHKPNVSVIIPTYNREQLLERAIKSVLEQTYKDFELIVIDDGSTDNTSRILRKYKKKIISYSTLHSGVSAARNFGINKSHGEWIALLDSDDYWYPQKLEKQIQWLENNSDYKIQQVGEKWIRNGKFVNPMNKHQKYHGWIFAQCLPLCIVSPSAVIIHRSVFDDIGLFNENMPVCEDYDLWLRISRKYPIGLMEEFLIVKTGGHDDQLSRKFWGMDRFRVESLERLLNEYLADWQRELVIKEIVHKLEVLNLGREKRDGLPNIFGPKLNEYRKIMINENYKLAQTSL